MIQASICRLDLSTNATRRIWHCAILIVSLAIGLTGCQSFGKHEADVKIIYERSAQYHMPDRNPVIVIPGILGSKLIDRDSRRMVWGAFDPESVDPTTPEGARLISLPVEGNRPLSELRDGVEPNGVLDKVHINLFGIPLDIRAYVGILTTLGAGGYRDEALGLHAIDYGDDHFTCFQFDYDWRRDNVENAKRLKQFIEAKRAYVQQAYKKRYGIEEASVKFDIVAHSMGSLVARYFLMYGDADLPEQGQDAIVTWAGADYVDRLILVGPPNAGSINALTQLIEGFDVGRPLLPYYQSALLGTFPALYELLPRPRHGAIVWDGDKSAPALNLYDPALWDRYEWGLASREDRNVSFLRLVLPDAADDEERRRAALALQTTILRRTKAFHEAMDKPARLPSGVDVFLIVGDAVDTPKRASVDRKTGTFKIVEYGAGDGTVLRSSALLDERIGGEWRPGLVSPIDWSSVLFLFSDHLGLTQDDAFADNVLYWLLEDPRTRTPKGNRRSSPTLSKPGRLE
jgi:pimeloyl-ACP methyl ester carboxylesterase